MYYSFLRGLFKSLIILEGGNCLKLKLWPIFFLFSYKPSLNSPTRHYQTFSSAHPPTSQDVLFFARKQIRIVENSSEMEIINI